MFLLPYYLLIPTPLKMFLCNWMEGPVPGANCYSMNEKLPLFNETPKLVWFLSKFQWNSFGSLQYQKVFSSCKLSTFCPTKEIRSSLWTRRKVYWYLVKYITISLPCQHWHGCWVTLPALSLKWVIILCYIKLTYCST